jgi:hypothetical protein
MRICNYLSGTVNCLGPAVVKQVWKKVKSSKGFTICKMINRMSTSSRDLVCIGHLNFIEPIRLDLVTCDGKVDVDVFLVTLRICQDVPILDGYRHFEHLRINHRLSSFYTPEQLFIPDLCNPEEKENKETLELPLRLQQRTHSMPQMLNLPGKQLCPKNHHLQRMPVSFSDQKCARCERTLKLLAIMHYCVSCQWLLCKNCFRIRGGMKRASTTRLVVNGSISF